MHLSFLTSHNLLFFRFCKTSKKTTFSVFLSFFLVKSPTSQSSKLNISRMAWPILMILVSFCRILNCLSDEINLFWRCSSPLTKLSCANVLQIRYATNYASASTSACVTAVHMLHTKLHFRNCSHFSEREENVCLSISCLFQTISALHKKIVDVIGSEYLTKDTAVSQKCQQNISKSAQRHEYKQQ